MLQIRNGIFETNSSSVHSITICPENDYNKWVNGELYIDESDKLVSLDEAIEEISKYYTIDKDNIGEMLFDNGYRTYDEYMDRAVYFEVFGNSYTTEHGDKIRVFGYYGFDG